MSAFCPASGCPPRGFTFIELLVTISIIGMLMALLFPAIHAARESARNMTCQNHLRQLGGAMMAHEVNFQRLPTGGWGGGWVSHADRGTGRRQPGGWAHALLPYMERNDLFLLGRGAPDAQRRADAATLTRMPMTVFNCPSRRSAVPYPVTLFIARQPRDCDPVDLAARSDYAANAGDQPRCEIQAYTGPASLADGDRPDFPWPDVKDHTGVVYLRSQITFGHIRDGLSHTYLMGEKYVSPENYYTGGDHGDDWSVYTGYQDDICRTAWYAPMLDGSADRWMPAECRFGSPHPRGWNVIMCDGSVRTLSFDIDLDVHSRLANRADGEIIDDADLWP
jgi:prepilin-type N-terminal cleavage/methylation domain-containing protein